MNDVELTAALNKLYATGDAFAERVKVFSKEEKCEPKLARETYILPMGVSIEVRYDQKCFCICTQANVVNLNFNSLRDIVEFYDWIINNKEL